LARSLSIQLFVVSLDILGVSSGTESSSARSLSIQLFVVSLDVLRVSSGAESSSARMAHQSRRYESLRMTSSDLEGKFASVELNVAEFALVDLAIKVTSIEFLGIGSLQQRKTIFALINSKSKSLAGKGEPEKSCNAKIFDSNHLSG
jgi:hypothetical protein